MSALLYDMLYTYLDQISDCAKRYDLRVSDAVKAAGMPASTYWRWVSFEVQPSEQAARKVMEHIHILGAGNGRTLPQAEAGALPAVSDSSIGTT